MFPELPDMRSSRPAPAGRNRPRKRRERQRTAPAYRGTAGGHARTACDPSRIRHAWGCKPGDDAVGGPHGRKADVSRYLRAWGPPTDEPTARREVPARGWEERPSAKISRAALAAAEGDGPTVGASPHASAASGFHWWIS